MPPRPVPSAVDGLSLSKVQLFLTIAWEYSFGHGTVFPWGRKPNSFGKIRFGHRTVSLPLWNFVGFTSEYFRPHVIEKKVENSEKLRYMIGRHVTLGIGQIPGVAKSARSEQGSV